MSTPTRREKIEQLLSADPEDTFLRYSLALELRKEGRHEESVGRLRELTTLEPPYVPAFFMAAQQLAELDQVDEARGALRDGIAAADVQGNAHAATEMREFLAALGALG